MAYEKHEAARLTAGEVGGSVASLTAPDTVVLSLAGCKSRDPSLLTKICIVKAMVFPIVMCGMESWPIRKDEHEIIDTFEL